MLGTRVCVCVLGGGGGGRRNQLGQLYRHFRGRVKVAWRANVFHIGPVFRRASAGADVSARISDCGVWGCHRCCCLGLVPAFVVIRLTFLISLFSLFLSFFPPQASARVLAPVGFAAPECHHQIVRDQCPDIVVNHLSPPPLLICSTRCRRTMRGGMGPVGGDRGMAVTRSDRSVIAPERVDRDLARRQDGEAMEGAAWRRAATRLRRYD